LTLYGLCPALVTSTWRSGDRRPAREHGRQWHAAQPGSDARPRPGHVRDCV